jgi:hypothetical protein
MGSIPTIQNKDRISRGYTSAHCVEKPFQVPRMPSQYTSTFIEAQSRKKGHLMLPPAAMHRDCFAVLGKRVDAGKYSSD